MNRYRICLVSPSHLSLNPRLVKEARALRAAGHMVEIVCARYTSWGMAADRELAADLGRVTWVPFGPQEASKITYLRQTVIRRLADMLSRAGLWRVSAIAARAQHPIAGDLARAVRRIQADHYVAHYIAALPAVSAAARAHGKRYSFDAEDFHLGDLPNRPKHRFERRLIRAVESRFLPGAATITVAAPLIAKAYAREYAIPRPTTVLNLFPRSAAAPAPTESGTVAPGPTIYWFSQVIGPGRGLELLLQAAARAASRPHLFMRGVLTAGYGQKLRDIAAGLGMDNRLHFLDRIPPDVLERDGAQFDLGYVGERAETTNRAIALTNKLFSYLSSGLPMLISDIPAHRDILPKLSIAAECFLQDDAADLATKIDLMLEPARLAQSRKFAWALGQGAFAWESEAPRLVDAIIGTMERPCAAA